MNSEITPPSTPHAHMQTRMQTRSSIGQKRNIQTISNPTYPLHKRARLSVESEDVLETNVHETNVPNPANEIPFSTTRSTPSTTRSTPSTTRSTPSTRHTRPNVEPEPEPQPTKTKNKNAQPRSSPPKPTKKDKGTKKEKDKTVVEEEEYSSSSWETSNSEEEDEEEEESSGIHSSNIEDSDESETLGNTEDDDEYWDEEETYMRNTLIKTLISLLILELRNKQRWEDDYDEEDDDDEEEEMDCDDDEEEMDCDEGEDEDEDEEEEEEKFRGRSRWGYRYRIAKDRDSNEREKEKEKEKDRKSNNIKKFCEITKYKNSHECVDFFRTLDKEQQFEYLQKLEPFQKKLVNTKPLLLMILDLPDAEDHNKLVAIEKINTIARLIQESNGSTGEEISKINGWVHQFMRIPFGKYQSIPVSLESAPADQRLFLYNARQTLDQVIYGMTDAKIQIIQLVGQILVNPMAANTSIGIEGPAGTGKTTLIKDGLSRIFNRPTKFIPLGGAVEGSMLDGSPSVYIGSKCGAIVNALMTSQTMNPIFIFDELDKLPDSSKGYEVTQVLMRLTDSTQNNTFSDKYFEDVELDLSKCTCVFSYNDLSKIDPTMASRLFKIKTEGYSYKDKIVIGRDYLLPKILQQMNFAPSDVQFEEAAFRQILDRQDSGEKGVRSFKHAMETICSKINISRLLNTKNDEEYNPLGEITFPFRVSPEIVKKLIPNKNFNPSHMMYT